MEFKFIFVMCLFLTVSWVTSNGNDFSYTAELYWKSELPNTPIPINLIHLLRNSEGSLKQNGSYRATGEGGISLAPNALTCCFCNYWYKCLSSTHPASVFFTKQELQKGSTMTLDLTKITNSLPLLSRSVADSIPFSLNKFPEIIDRFSVAPDSPEAKVINNTIKLCEIAEENKVCATSLESLVDFIKTQVGDDAKFMSTEAKGPKVQRYRMVEVVKEAEESRPMVSCHKLNYVYVVFYCHKVHNVTTYRVKLVGEDGTQVMGVAVCHLNEEEEEASVRKLGLFQDKKGLGDTLCHFLPEDHFLVYTNNNNK